MFSSLVPALGLSKTSLSFESKENEKTCQMITISSADFQGMIKIRDMWASSYSEGGNLNRYAMSSSDLDLSIYYETEINFEENLELEVCVTSRKAGKYKGALIFTPESESNIVVEVGVWLYVETGKESKESSKSSSNSNSPNPRSFETIISDPKNDLDFQQLSDEEQPLINLDSFKTTTNQFLPSTFVLFLLVSSVIFLIVLTILVKIHL